MMNGSHPSLFEEEPSRDSAGLGAVLGCGKAAILEEGPFAHCVEGTGEHKQGHEDQAITHHPTKGNQTVSGLCRTRPSSFRKHDATTQLSAMTNALKMLGSIAKKPRPAERSGCRGVN